MARQDRSLIAELAGQADRSPIVFDALLDPAHGVQGICSPHTDPEHQLRIPALTDSLEMQSAGEEVHGGARRLAADGLIPGQHEVLDRRVGLSLSSQW